MPLKKQKKIFIFIIILAKYRHNQYTVKICNVFVSTIIILTGFKKRNEVSDFKNITSFFFNYYNYTS